MSIRGSIVAAWPFLVLLASAGAGPNRSLPVPPIPPPHPPTARNAPMPNRDAVGPLTSPEKGPQVQLKDFRADPFQQSGLGYSRGSQCPERRGQALDPDARTDRAGPATVRDAGSAQRSAAKTTLNKGAGQSSHLIDSRVTGPKAAGAQNLRHAVSATRENCHR